MNFIYFNPNPDGQLIGDCIIRAAVAATDAPYNYIKYKLENKKLPAILDCYKALGATTFGNLNVPASVVCSFCEQHSYHSFILIFNDHCAGIRNNTIYDTFDCRIKDHNVQCLSVFYLSDDEIEDFGNKLNDYIFKYLYDEAEKRRGESAHKKI